LKTASGKCRFNAAQSADSDGCLSRKMPD